MGWGFTHKHCDILLSPYSSLFHYESFLLSNVLIIEVNIQNRIIIPNTQTSKEIWATGRGFITHEFLCKILNRNFILMSTASEHVVAGDNEGENWH